MYDNGILGCPNPDAAYHSQSRSPPLDLPFTKGFFRTMSLLKVYCSL